jgi:hypothetical protein
MGELNPRPALEMSLLPVIRIWQIAQALYWYFCLLLHYLNEYSGHFIE